MGIHQWLLDSLHKGPVKNLHINDTMEDQHMVLYDDIWWYYHQMSSCNSICWSSSNPPVTCGFPAQRASNVDSASMSWHHHATPCFELAPYVPEYFLETEVMNVRVCVYMHRHRRLPLCLITAAGSNANITSAVRCHVGFDILIKWSQSKT